MKLFFARLFCLPALATISAYTCIAQTKTMQNTLQAPHDSIKVDGNLQEWGDSLRFFNGENQIHYAISNDKDNLYIAAKITDRSQQIRILHAGLTLGIDTKGKKKSTFAITFPLAQQGDAMSPDILTDTGGDITKEDRDELMQARLTKLREIKVDGFKDVESDMITTSNTYGFQLAIDYDKDGNLVYEAAIPLKFFHADDITKTEWAFDFKINGITRPPRVPQDPDSQQAQSGGRGGRGGGGGMGGGGRGGHGGGRGGHGGGFSDAGSSDHSALSKSVDFWEKYYLAG